VSGGAINQVWTDCMASVCVERTLAQRWAQGDP